MPPILTSDALATCSFGVAPSPLGAIPAAMVFIGGKMPVTMSDNVPMLNVKPFGMCTSLANPQVAAATAAALGALTPMPCVPTIAAPWAPPVPTVLIGNKPAATISSMCTCAWAGVITITVPGAPTTMAG